MSDDGEPSGTAGRPALAVVQGADLGDVVVVLVRYFGGTKLGTGGLVKAYTQTAQAALAALQVKTKVLLLAGRLIVPSIKPSSSLPEISVLNSSLASPNTVRGGP